MGLFDWLVKNSARSLIKRELKNAAQNELKDLSRLRISDVTRKGWLPTQWKSTQQEAIRQARALRSQMSKAELNWMQANPNKATKNYKSGTREFGGQANKEALQKARQEVLKQFIPPKTDKNYKKKLGYTIAALGGIPAAAVIANKIPLTHQILGYGVQMLPDDLQNYAYQGGPYVRQWLDYNTGGQKYGLEMSPDMAEQYLQDAIAERVGDQNYQVGDTISNTPLGTETKTYHKYMTAGGDSARVADAMYSQLGNIEHVVVKPNNKLQVIDAYDWEPMDTKEGYDKRIKTIKKSLQRKDGNYSTSDLWRARMERPAQWAAEHNFLAPDMNKMNVRSERKHNPNLKPKAWVGYDFQINQK